MSPLRALSNDIHQNLEQPLREIAEHAAQAHATFPGIRVGLHTGDTTSSQRTALLRSPPHILVTTPESLYLPLTSDRGHKALQTVQTVLVDEIHVLVRDRRSSHLALTLELLKALTECRLQRIGLSATQNPIEQVARFLVGSCEVRILPSSVSSDEAPHCDTADDRDTVSIVDVGHQQELDLAIEVP